MNIRTIHTDYPSVSSTVSSVNTLESQPNSNPIHNRQNITIVRFEPNIASQMLSCSRVFPLHMQPSSNPSPSIFNLLRLMWPKLVKTYATHTFTNTTRRKTWLLADKHYVAHAICPALLQSPHLANIFAVICILLRNFMCLNTRLCHRQYQLNANMVDVTAKQHLRNCIVVASSTGIACDVGQEHIRWIGKLLPLRMHHICKRNCN